MAKIAHGTRGDLMRGDIMSGAETEYTIIRRDLPTMYFVGVTTSKSSIMRLFPRWARTLGIEPAQLIGVDLPLHASRETYRQVVAQMRYDPLSLGAMVTTHKIDVLDAAGDLFDELDTNARLCHEVSCISKRDGRLIGSAKDPVTAGRSLDDMLGKGYWGRTGGHVLCLGAGGAGIAIAMYLLTRPDPTDRPERIIVVNRSPARLEQLRSVVAALQTRPSSVSMEYVLTEDPRENDRLMADLPPGSMVINATGMGKDRPGSPITDHGVFPRQGVVWELNYRGELAFLHQAEAQARQRKLVLHDGWRYFLHGWSELVAEVFHCTLTAERFMELAEVAEFIRR